MPIKTYHRLLTAYPLLTQSLSTGLLFATGDVIAQQFIETKSTDATKQQQSQQQPQHDLARTARLAFYGTVIGGPAMVGWYRLLENYVRLSTPLKTLMGRVTLDQFVFAPTFIGCFFSATSLMEGKTWDETKNKLEKAYPPALMNNYKLWPAVQLMNFYLVPLNYRSLVVNTVALGWNSYLSYENQRHQ